jgi:hypothetical protein
MRDQGRRENEKSDERQVRFEHRIRLAGDAKDVNSESSGGMRARSVRRALFVVAVFAFVELMLFFESR